MNSLATLPATEMELSSVSFFGRTWDEYCRFFALHPRELRGRAVLDVAAGPSSFVAEASEEDIDAVAVDPMYNCSPTELDGRVRHDYDRMFAQMRTKPHLFRLKSFRSFDEAELDRRTAARRFLADYETNSRHGRYVRAALPLLPFLDGAFDFVLCAHLLFIYSARFDFQWHLEACSELARVSSGDVRIHPVCGANGRPYPELARLRRELAGRAVQSEVRAVDYEFFAGGTSMLVLRSKAGRSCA